MQKFATIGPAGPRRQWGEISCSNVFHLFFVISCAALENTFLRVSPPFLRQSTCFLGGSQLQDQKSSPPKPRNMNFKTPSWRDNFRPKRFIMGRLISKLPLTSPEPPKSCIVNRQIGVGDSQYVVISDPYSQVT